MINVNQIKKDFPIFQTNPNLVYLDSTATSLKPRSVIDKEREYYQNYSANIFRGVYPLSEKATEEYEKTRAAMADFINAYSKEEIIFTRNTTESINLIAWGLGRQLVNKGDEVVVSLMEHHSNFVPWQVLCQEKKAKLKIIKVEKTSGLLEIVDQKNQINKKKLEQTVTKKTKILALTYISNVLGTINPIKEIIQAVKEINKKIIVIVDGAQALPHQKIDLKNLGADFFVGSSHKMLGPTGVGILWGRFSLLEQMRPVFYGGEMIEKVTVEKTSFQKPPHRFEAGTPAIAQVVGLSSAIDYLKKIGLEKIEKYEKELVRYCLKKLKEEFQKKIEILGEENVNYRAGIVSFNIKKIHPHDLAYFLGEKNICLRSGHHCAMPLHQYYGINASIRASFYLYNDFSDVDKLVGGIKKGVKFFQ